MLTRENLNVSPNVYIGEIDAAESCILCLIEDCNAPYESDLLLDMLEILKDLERKTRELLER